MIMQTTRHDMLQSAPILSVALLDISSSPPSSHRLSRPLDGLAPSRLSPPQTVSPWLSLITSADCRRSPQFVYITGSQSRLVRKSLDVLRLTGCPQRVHSEDNGFTGWWPLQTFIDFRVHRITAKKFTIYIMIHIRIVNSNIRVVANKIHLS